MTGSTPSQESYDGYQRLFAEVKRRWYAPRGHPTYMAYFVGSLVFSAAIGVWLELFKLFANSGSDWGSLRTAIATYFPAILGSVAMQLAISDALRSLRAWGQILAALFGMLSPVIILTPNLADGAAILLGLVGSVFALAFWWIANADEASFKDEAVGGTDPQAPLLGGDSLEGFDS